MQDISIGAFQYQRVINSDIRSDVQCDVEIILFIPIWGRIKLWTPYFIIVYSQCISYGADQKSGFV